MSSDERAEETQRKTLRGLIAETQTSCARFAGERTTFAEAFRETCGHNRLEQIGIAWSTALSPSQVRVLARDHGAAVSFATHLHRSLMCHLLPTDGELDAMPKATIMQWTAALRMGIQGVLRRRAQISGEVTGSAHFMTPTLSFLETLQPVMRHAADEFFEAQPEQKVLVSARTA